MCFSSRQFTIYNCWREVRCWSPMLSNDLKFWNPPMKRVVRLEGSKFSSGKDSTARKSLGKDYTAWKSLARLDNINVVKECNLFNPQSILVAKSFSETSILKRTRLDGRPSFGKDLGCGQFLISKCWRDGRSLCMFVGMELRRWHLLTINCMRLGAGNPPLGKATKLGQSSIFKEIRSIRWCPSKTERDSILLQVSIRRTRSFGKMCKGNDYRVLQL